MTPTPPWRADAWSLSADFAKIEQQWESIREILESPTGFERRDPEVSGWSCGEHAGHVVLVALAMSRGIERCLVEPARHQDREWSAGTGAMLDAGHFPRGRAESPPQVRPSGHSREDLLRRLPLAVAAFDALAARETELRACPARFRHFVFGYLTGPEWVRMCAIHTAHHLAIVRDIVSGTETKENP